MRLIVCETDCLCFVYTIVLVWLIMTYQHSEPEHFQLLAEVRTYIYIYMYIATNLTDGGLLSFLTV